MLLFVAQSTDNGIGGETFDNRGLYASSYVVKRIIGGCVVYDDAIKTALRYVQLN